MLAPPLEPGESTVYAASGDLKAQARLDFLPELRNMIATGVIEGVINARNLNTRALVPATRVRRLRRGASPDLARLERRQDRRVACARPST